MKQFVLVSSMLLSSFALAETVHISDFGCGMLNAQGGSVITTDSRVTASPTSAGLTTFTCSAKNVANPSGRTVHWNFENTGYLCNTRIGTTKDWSETLNPNGTAILTCRVRK